MKLSANTMTAMVDRLRERKRNYQATFGIPGTPGHEAMKDLAQFCRAFGNGEVVPDNHDLTLVLAGRREAFFRIYSHLNLEPDELASLYKATVIGEER